MVPARTGTASPGTPRLAWKTDEDTSASAKTASPGSVTHSERSDSPAPRGQKRARCSTVAVVQPLRGGDETQCIARLHQLGRPQHEVQVQSRELRGRDAQRSHPVAVPHLPLGLDVVVPDIWRIADVQAPPVPRKVDAAEIAHDHLDAIGQPFLVQALMQQIEHPVMRLDCHYAGVRKPPCRRYRESATARASVDDRVESFLPDFFEHAAHQPRRGQRDAMFAPRFGVVCRAVGLAQRVFIRSTWRLWRGREQRQLGRCLLR